MRALFTWRNFALLLVFAHLCRLSFFDHGVWHVLLFDGLALALIMFSREIDDMTFGQWFPDAGKITAHTPPFLIAGFGWLMLLANTAMLFFTNWLKMPAGG
jgi:hypothetical protein